MLCAPSFSFSVEWSGGGEAPRPSFFSPVSTWYAVRRGEMAVDRRPRLFSFLSSSLSYLYRGTLDLSPLRLFPSEQIGIAEILGRVEVRIALACLFPLPIDFDRRNGGAVLFFFFFSFLIDTRTTRSSKFDATGPPFHAALVRPQRLSEIDPSEPQFRAPLSFSPFSFEILNTKDLR